MLGISAVLFLLTAFFIVKDWDKAIADEKGRYLIYKYFHGNKYIYIYIYIYIYNLWLFLYAELGFKLT